MKKLLGCAELGNPNIYRQGEGRVIYCYRKEQRQRVILEVAKGQADLEWDVRGESKADVTF